MLFNETFVNDMNKNYARLLWYQKISMNMRSDFYASIEIYFMTESNFSLIKRKLSYKVRVSIVKPFLSLASTRRITMYSDVPIIFEYLSSNNNKKKTNERSLIDTKY